MRTPLAFLALVCFSGGLTDPQEREHSGPAGDPPRYGRLVLLPEDSIVPDAFEAPRSFFPESLQEDHCEIADAENENVAVRIDVLRLLRQEHGEMPRFRGPGASWSLEPYRGLGRVASSTSGPSSAGRPR